MRRTVRVRVCAVHTFSAGLLMPICTINEMQADARCGKLRVIVVEFLQPPPQRACPQLKVFAFARFVPSLPASPSRANDASRQAWTSYRGGQGAEPQQ